MNNHTIRWDEISFYSIFRAVVRNLWAVVLCALSAVMCFISINQLTYQPQYTSTATFMVSARDSTNAYNSLSMTQSMATVFSEVFQSNVLRDKVQAAMGDTVFNGAINTRTIPETNLMIVSVVSPSPEISFQGLTHILENYSSISEHVFANAQLEVIKDPVVPTAPSNPLNIRSRLPFMALLGAMLVLGATVVLAVLHDTVQTPKAARRKLDAHLLRAIHHEVRNKTARSKLTQKHIAPLVVNPLISTGFIEDNMNLCSTMEYHMRKRNQQVILVTSAGENEGKSTVAANLALTLAAKDKKVIILDCDFRKPSLHKIFESPATQNCFSAYLSGSCPEDACLIEHKHGVTLGLSRTEDKGVNRLIHSGALKAFLEKMRTQTDYIVLDTPPMLAAADSEAIARLADTAVMVVRADFMLTPAINDCLDNLRKSVPDLAGIVLNNYHGSR